MKPNQPLGEMRTVRMFLYAAGLCVCFSTAFSGDGTGFRIPASFELKSAALPIYRDAETTPVAILWADRIYTDYERKGFYRIGVLPVSVMEGVALEICRPDEVVGSLPAISHRFEEQFANRFEIRGLKLRIAPSPAACLEAGRARAGREGCLELLDGVRIIRGTNLFQAKAARVQLTGPDAGRVILKTTPPQTNLWLALPKP
jgi:hypothetical protein